MAGIFKNLDASDIRLTPFRAYKRFAGSDSYVTYSAILNTTVADGQEDIGNPGFYGAESVVLTTNDKSANSVWHSIYSQYYKYYYNNPKASFGHIDPVNQPRFMTNKALVISIPQSNFGESIEPTSILLTVSGVKYVDDLYGNIVAQSNRWGSGQAVTASNIVYSVKPTTLTHFINKTISSNELSGADLYHAGVQYNNVYVTSSFYETILKTDSSSFNTSSIVITPDGADVNKLFNFQNKDFSIIIGFSASVSNDCVVLEKKQESEVIKVDLNGDTHIQPVNRYPYRISLESGKIAFRKSDGATTLLRTSSFSYNGNFPIVLARTGSTYYLGNGANNNTFTDTLYSQERYCANGGRIFIGADENGGSGSIAHIGRVTFHNRAYSHVTYVLMSVAATNNNNPYRVFGTVMRQQGFIIITDRGLVNTIQTSGIADLQYRGTTTIYENEISCTVGPGEFGMSYNPTLHQYDPNIDEYKLADFATGSEFRPYITRIGLYNDNNQLVAIGTLNQPIQLPKNVDTTFIIRYDL